MAGINRSPSPSWWRGSEPIDRSTATRQSGKKGLVGDDCSDNADGWPFSSDLFSSQSGVGTQRGRIGFRRRGRGRTRRSGLGYRGVGDMRLETPGKPSTRPRPGHGQGYHGVDPSRRIEDPPSTAIKACFFPLDTPLPPSSFSITLDPSIASSSGCPGSL